MIAVHLTFGAMDTLRLFRDDADRVALLDLAEADPDLGPVQIGGVLNPTHQHTNAVGDPAMLLAAAERVAAAYVRYFNQKYRCPGFKLRGPVDMRIKETVEQLRFSLIYDHKDPVRSGRLERPIDEVWSSQRDYAGLAVTGRWNLSLARDVLGPAAFEDVAGWRPPLADLTPSVVPLVRPGRILGAAAQVFGILPEQVLTRKHDWRIALARRCYAHLGRIEGYTDLQLAEPLGLDRSRIARAATQAIAHEAVMAARTLLREPGLSQLIRAPMRPCVDPDAEAA